MKNKLTDKINAARQAIADIINELPMENSDLIPSRNELFSAIECIEAAHCILPEE